MILLRLIPRCNYFLNNCTHIQEVSNFSLPNYFSYYCSKRCLLKYGAKVLSLHVDTKQQLKYHFFVFMCHQIAAMASWLPPIQGLGMNVPNKHAQLNRIFSLIRPDYSFKRSFINFIPFASFKRVQIFLCLESGGQEHCCNFRVYH